MSEGLEPTGERLIEEHYLDSPSAYVIYLMHIAGYRYAEQYCRGKQVLDLGCGSGYGSAMIAKVAKSVHAVDVSEEAVAYAKSHYPQENLCFASIEPGKRLSCADQSFDVVLSFQVIEHVLDDSGYLAEVARLLREDGTLLLITPNRAHRLFAGQKPWNRWHLREYSISSLSRLASKHFHSIKMLHMGANPTIAEIEIRRYRLLKWATLPFTFFGAPEVWRHFWLNLIHRSKPAKTRQVARFDPKFGIESITISEDAMASLNLIVIGTQGSAAQTTLERR